ncbi:unnamed protein product [Peronospora belbahrii]|uniref:Uncharacterized protein n=1 Tax=Peronospora belbahrii TaxID=622444 RepID=A0ABN8CWF8_9STRA|nr:unnamed protein product [Peronospora belbahrii]
MSVACRARDLWCKFMCGDQGDYLQVSVMCCYNPVDSRAMSVLLASRTRSEHSWNHQFLVLIEHFHAQLKRRRGCRDVYKNRTKGQLRLGQVCVLLRDLLLVASGLRPSCLVDCCALKKGVAKLLPDYLDENEASQQWFD